MRFILNKTIIILAFFSSTTLSYGQKENHKMNVIIDSLGLFEYQKSTLIDLSVRPLKYEAMGEDSLKLIQIENLLTDQEIRKRIAKGIHATFSNKEINKIYDFVTSSAFHKLFKSEFAIQNIENQFKDITIELNRIFDSVNKSNNVKTPQSMKFEPIPIDRPDGFYATIDYIPGEDDKNIKLEEVPAITREDISIIKKDINNYGEYYIFMTLTEDGSKKFYLLTKNNLYKPIAIVIDKHIISLPRVNAAISGGNISIGGGYTEYEVDELIQKLKN